MIRLAWLQSRTQSLIAIAGLALVALCLVLTGPGLVHLYDTMIAPCAAQGCSGSTISAFLQTHNDLGNWLHILVLVVPGILGVFWGAPLVARELETGTYRLADGETRSDPLRQHGGRRTAQPHGDVVEHSARPCDRKRVFEVRRA